MTLLLGHVGLLVNEILNLKHMNMRKGLVCLCFLIGAAIILGSQDFYRLTGSKGDDSAVVNGVVDSVTAILEGNGDSIGNGKGLNDIRFADFKDEDWLDNEYIRCLRKYLDDYNSGKIKDGGLDPYKKKVRGKFVIGSVHPYLLGGLFIRIMFVDNPDDIFSAWVYSSVDMETETILDYSVHGISHDDERSGFTTEDVLSLLKKHPEQKVW